MGWPIEPGDGAACTPRAKTRITMRGTPLVPELLTKNEPDVNWKDATECLNFEYAYAVLPSGLVPRVPLPDLPTVTVRYTGPH
jgi:hypothetical protein